MLQKPHLTLYRRQNGRNNSIGIQCALEPVNNHVEAVKSAVVNITGAVPDTGRFSIALQLHVSLVRATHRAPVRPGCRTWP